MSDIRLKALRERLLEYNYDMFRDARIREERVALLTIFGRVIEVKNNHPNPYDHFRLHNTQVDRALGQSDTLFAVLHTHPPGKPAMPSSDDLDSIKPGVLGIVWHVMSGVATMYEYNNVMLSERIRKPVFKFYK